MGLWNPFTSPAFPTAAPSLLRRCQSHSLIVSVILVFCLFSRLSTEEVPSTASATAKEEFPCAFNDTDGNLIDLSRLEKGKGVPWSVRDSRPGRADLFYDLHVCRRLEKYPGSACEGQASACQRIIEKDGNVTYKNLGLLDGPPIRLADNSVRLHYSNGTFCHRSSRPRSASIEFLCDPNAPDDSPPVFVDETAGCTYKFVWRTKAVCTNSKVDTRVPCVLRDLSHEHDYDLSGLRRSDFDYVTPLDGDAGNADSKGEIREVHVNFCDVLVSLPEAAKENCAQSGACLIKKFTNGSVINAVSLGKPRSPEVALDDRTGLSFHFQSSTSTETSCGTTVRLLCSSPEEANQTPFKLFEFGCLTILMMATSEACPKSDGPLEGPDCSIRFADGDKELLDLRELRDAGDGVNGSYLVSTKDYDYSINVCGPTIACEDGSGDSESAGVCQTEKHANKRFYSAGKFSRTLRRITGDVLELKYDSGSPCLNGAFNRTTVIYFTCDQYISAKDSRPIFIDENDECNYEFHWPTPLACRRSLECVVTVPSPTSFDTHHVGYVDLKKLAKAQGNHEGAAFQMNLFSQFLINVCRPTNSETNKKCPPGSGICMPSTWGDQPHNLGFPSSEPVFVLTKAATLSTPAEGFISLNYTHGDLCPAGNQANETKRISSEIQFFCKPGSEVGSPRLVNDDKPRCHYVFEWHSNAACPPDAEINEKTCSVRFSDSDHTFDLSKIPKIKNGDLEARHEYSKSEVHWNICGPVAHLNGSGGGSGGVDPCENSAVCVINSNGTRVSYGSADKMRLRRDRDNIRLMYSGGYECKAHWLSKGMEGKAHSEIKLICDHHKEETEVYVVTPCWIIMRHRSPFFCAPMTEKCFLTYDNRFYDLRLLSAQEKHSWPVEGKEVSYRLNVCANIQGVNGCSSESAVCTLPKEGSSVAPKFSWNSSAAISQRLEMIRPENQTKFLQLTYFGESKCPNRTVNGGHYITQIRFQCGTHVGSPVLVEENEAECRLVFSWTSRAACAVTREEVTPDANGILVDPYSNRNMNVSAIIHPDKDIDLSVDERINGDRYVYLIRLGGPVQFRANNKHESWKNCMNASVCQTKHTGTFYRDVGSHGSLKFFMEDGQLEAEFEGGKCGRVPTKNTKSVFRFFCDFVEHMPQFAYESASCDYIFSWRTPHACPIGESPTKSPAVVTTTPPKTTQTGAASSAAAAASTTPPAVASTSTVPDGAAGNGSDATAKKGRAKAVNHTAGAIVAVIVIAIVMLVVFYVASPRFRNKVNSIGQRLRRPGSPFQGSAPGFEPIADDSFAYHAGEMDIKDHRSRSAYGAHSTTRRQSSDDPTFGPSSTSNGFNDQTERDDAFLVT